MHSCFVSIAILVLCVSLQPTQLSRSIAHQPIHARATVGVIDPRVEVMFAVQLLAGYEECGLISSFSTKYKKAMQDYFAPYRDHAAVKMFKERMYKGFNFAAPFEFMLSHDTPEQMNALRPYSASLVKNLGGQQQAEEFRKLMAQFAKDSKFAEFFRQQAPLYNSITSKAVEELQLQQMIRDIEQYTGLPLSHAGIVFMPLGHQGGFGLHLSGVSDRDESISLIGPQAVEKEIPLYKNDADTKLLIWHELAHPLINPLVDKSEKHVDKSLGAFKIVRKRLEAEACGDWPACVKETLVRAVVIRLAEKHLGANVALAERIKVRRHGWVYVDEILPLLEQMERERGSGKSIVNSMEAFLNRLEFVAESVKGQF